MMIVDPQLICTKNMLSKVAQGLKRKAHAIQREGSLSNINSIGAHNSSFHYCYKGTIGTYL